MNLRTIIVTATTAAVLATSGVAIAGATTGSAPSTSTSASAPSSAPAAQSPTATGRRFATGDRAARRLRIRRLVRGAGNVVAKAIGIDRLTLRQGLAAGQTIAEIATAKHVDSQVVIDALVNAAKPKLEAAVAAGKIDATRAARIEQKLPARITKFVNEWHPRRVRNHAAP